MRRTLLLAMPVLAGLAAPALGDTLAVTKTATLISDPMANPNPRAIPGAVVDYKLLFTNPASNLALPVKNIAMTDTLPANVILRVTDIAAAGKGPIAFDDGSALGLGLLGSGLTCPFTSLADTSDCVDFYDGTSWSYVPVPDANGYDANVRAIRVHPTTTFATGGSFQLRYRVKIR